MGGTRRQNEIRCRNEVVVVCRDIGRCYGVAGIVDYVDSSRIVVRVHDAEAQAGEVGVDIYNLTKRFFTLRCFKQG